MGRKPPFYLFLWMTFCLIQSANVSSALPQVTAQGAPMPSLAPMLKQAMPAVVNIATYTTVRRLNPLLEDPFFRRFFDVPDSYGQAERRTQSAGSGVIVDADKGYILTNHHVIERSDEIEVTLLDGRRLPAMLVGSDKQVDIALLKVESRHLSDIPVNSSSSLEVGDFVVAIGNPFGLGQTVTSGIVSALGRSGLGIYGYEDFIQTDASINPGNSGGALVNLRGELVGINSAIIAPAGGNVGIGFAIPAEIARSVMSQLIEHGEVRRGALGVMFQDISADLADAFGLASNEGAVIARVLADSPASQAGFREGDIVIEVDGRKVRDSVDLHNRIGLTAIGKPLIMKIIRSGRPLMLTAIIGEKPVPRSEGKAIHPLLSGLALRDFTPKNAEYSRAVQIERVDGGPGKEAGMRVGDIIVAANRQRVLNIQELLRAVKGERKLLLRIERSGQSFYAVIR